MMKSIFVLSLLFLACVAGGAKTPSPGEPAAGGPLRYLALGDSYTRAVALAGGDARRVVVLSIPDWGVTPFARRSGRDPVRISADIDRFNEVNRQEALKVRVRFVDVTPASRRAASEPSLLATDGLHYAGPMYREWADLALPATADAIFLRRP